MGRLQRMIAGTSILVDRSLVPQITSNGILLDKRTQYITLKLSYNENLTIANIYGVRTCNERALMWKRLSKANFDTSHVIIRGDFNHLKETDRRGKAGGTFQDEKRGSLLASYDASIWADGCLEAGQLSKNVQEGIHF